MSSEIQPDEAPSGDVKRVEERVEKRAFERIDSLYEISTRNDIQSFIDRALKLEAIRRVHLYSKTISITSKHSFSDVLGAMNRDWVGANKQSDFHHSTTDSTLQIVFSSAKAKQEFIKWQETCESILKEVVVSDVARPGLRMNKIEMPHVNSSLSASQVIAKVRISLEQVKLDHEELVVTPIREGKAHKFNNSRSLMFDCNGMVLRHLIESFGCSLPYLLEPPGGRGLKSFKLRMKLNCRPWKCGLCHSIGRHECIGRVCLTCSSTDHKSTSASCNGYSYCINCLRTGHRSSSTNCPILRRTIVRNLINSDIPIELMSDDEMRTRLIEMLIYY